MSNQTEPKKMSAVSAMQTFFSEGRHGRKVEMSEFKALSAEERKELGALCAAELGAELNA